MAAIGLCGIGRMPGLSGERSCLERRVQAILEVIPKDDSRECGRDGWRWDRWNSRCTDEKARVAADGETEA